MNTEEEKEKKRILDAIFGESSSSSTDNQEEDISHLLKGEQEVDSSATLQSYIWEPIKEIKGLFLCRDFLSLEKQVLLLTGIQKEGWFTEESHNQAMRFGDLPGWAIELSVSIQEAASGDVVHVYDNWGSCVLDSKICPLPSDILWREPFFDQLIVNVYQPGEGICAHVDLMRFEDGIAIISLESTCMMQFTQVSRESCSCKGKEKEDCSDIKIPVLLTPGSLIIMSGEARYLWKHEINRNAGFQVWEGREINQKKRTSVTLRKLRR